MTQPRKLQSISDFDQFASEHNAFVICKHSTTCPISAAGFSEYTKLQMKRLFQQRIFSSKKLGRYRITSPNITAFGTSHHKSCSFKTVNRSGQPRITTSRKMHSKRTSSNACYETSLRLFQTEDKAQFFFNEKDCAFLFTTNRYPRKRFRVYNMLLSLFTSLEKRFQSYIKNKIIFLSYYYL